MKKGELSFDDLKQIVDNLHDEIMVFDNDYNLIYVNKASMRHYGKTPEELVGYPFSKMDEVFWGNSTLPEVYHTKKPVAKRQITNLGNDIITISTPVFDENGEIKFVAQNVNDLYYINEISTMEGESLQITTASDDTRDSFPYESAKMSSIMEMVKKIKNITSPCLILGETGTGKSYLAKHIHNISNRKDKSFVSINCAAIHPNLIESELFGYKKGAFSGASQSGKKGLVEIADGGTLFLDEISEISYDLQAKLLHFIQEKEFIPVGGEQYRKVDVKILAATNRNLEQMVKSKSFREDLFYRLNTFEIILPPLRDRKDDVKILIKFYLNKYNTIYNRNLIFSKEALDVVRNYSWPGNIRELSHVLEKVVVLAQGEIITTSDLPKSVFELKAEKSYDNKTLDEIMEELEKKVIRDMYAKYKNSTRVAKELGTSQSKAYRLIQKYVK